MVLVLPQQLSQFQQYVDMLPPVLQDPTMFAVAAGLVVIVLYGIVSSLCSAPKVRPGKFSQDRLNDPKAKTRGYYDVAIVGAGPSGSTCAYYLSKHGASTLVLDKAQFPRDKHCGDAVCKTAIEILRDMTVKGQNLYDKLIAENKGHVADSGGFVSPSGLSFIGRSHEVLGDVPAALAVRRTDLDMEIAYAAKAALADLKENHQVEDAIFDKSKGLWTVRCANGASFQARVLVCADGATSVLAKKLGIVHGEPQGVCSRQFIKNMTKDRFKADGVVYYNNKLLPGYAALFRHPNNVVNYCTYLIPGNPNVKNEDLKKWHDYLVQKDPAVIKSLSNYNPEVDDEEPMKAGSLRLGGVPKSYANHLIVVGDAAGMIDPMTGEGIHHAMEGGKIAALTLIECIKAGNYSESAMKVYHHRWMTAFGADFKWSMAICQFLYKFPIFLDAAALAVQRKGNEFLARWADIMTGRVHKFHLLYPEFVIVISFEFMRLCVMKLFGKKPKTD